MNEEVMKKYTAALEAFNNRPQSEHEEYLRKSNETLSSRNGKLIQAIRNELGNDKANEIFKSILDSE